MKKRISMLLICLMLSLSFLLAGCDLFPRNQREYLNRPVATLEYKDGEKENITTESFISAFNSYGSTLLQNGTSTDDALEQTLNVLVNRYVLLHEAKQKIELSDADKKEVLSDTYDSVISNLSSFEDQVREDWDITIETTSADESTDENIVYNEYKQTAKIVVFVDDTKVLVPEIDYREDGSVWYNGSEINPNRISYRIELVEEDENTQTKNFKDLAAVQKAVKDIYFNQTSETTKGRVQREAYRRFIAVLKTNEEGLGLSENDDEIFERQLKKVYNNIEENKYITSMEDFYKTDEVYSTITVEQVLNKYKSLLATSKFTYENDNSAYNTAMLEKFEDVYYVVDDNYFNVSHVLIQFDDDQAEEYKNLETQRDSGELLYTEYVQRLNELVLEIKANARDTETGEVVSERELSATTVLENLKKELAKCNTDEQKTEVFKKYIYTYNEDPGVMNADYSYVIGKEDSKMVEAFTNASRDLNTKGEYGAISDLVVTEYGVHIIFYIGTVKNPITVDNLVDFKMNDSDILKLAETKLNAFHNKTVFDKVFETLSSDNYSIFENMNLNILKKDIKITKYSNVYKNL